MSYGCIYCRTDKKTFDDFCALSGENIPEDNMMTCVFEYWKCQAYQSAQTPLPTAPKQTSIFEMSEQCKQ